MKPKKTSPIRLSAPWSWPVLAQYALALFVVGAATLGRLWIDDSVGNRLHFILLFGALLPLVQLVRPKPFFLAAILGWLITVYLFQPRRMSFEFESDVDAFTSYFFALIFFLTSITAWLSDRSRNRHVHDRAALQEAEELREHLAAIVASSHDAIISKTLNGIITSWNQSAERLFGYTAQEAIGQSILMLLPEDLVQEESKILEKLRRGERIDNLETVRRCKNETLVDVALTVSPVRNSAGDIIGASKNARDITARKKAEQVLLETDRRKDEFLATLAHELRNPLAAIRLAMHVLDNASEDPARVMEMSALIQRQSTLLTRLIDDLMDVSRISKGKIKLELQRTDLGVVMKQFINDAEAMCEEHGMKLLVERFASKRSLIPVNADSARIAQVLNNILHNACKFTERGGTLRIILETNETTVEIRLIDTGKGIPAEQLQHVFKMYTQLEASGTRGYGGLGIGLSLARSIIEMHKGTLVAQSEGEGYGSEFIISLPLINTKPNSDIKAPSEDVAQQVVIKSIVAADDNIDALKAIALMLKLKGHQVQTAENGLEAIELIRHVKPDIALLDIGMPGIDGYEVVRQIRKEDWGQNMLVIAMTGWGQKRDQQQAYDAGFDLHMTKPVDFTRLQAYIAKETAKN